MEIQTQSVALSKGHETEGFDLQAGDSWIYPTNYPTREYQYNIIQEALLKNTLVSLPTGLGKTFIAAVVMYNFYRWYPHGKIIFMAPTRPLVKQQVEACYDIMAIPREVTAELTGTKVSSSRSDIWLDKRVFFATPQVLQNDLEKVAKLGTKIKCLVFDEAHKAKGNHAYCQVIRTLLDNHHKYFRVLALSATPGRSVNDVSEVVHNLLISHLEFRTEESKDVQPYVFQRSLETVVVPLGNKLMEIRDEYIKILEYYAKTLIKFNIIQGNCGSLTKGKIFMIMKDFKNKSRGPSSSHYSEIMRCLNICVTLYHAFELLIRHGLRNFLSFFDEHIEKPLLRGNIKLKYILDNVRNYLGPIPHIEILPDGTYPEIPKDIMFGHPKHYKLRDILISHFSGDDKKNSRVIVFFEYRESVMEAHTLLLQSRPLIQPKIFLGQGPGVTQKTQLGVVKAFREGKCNTLLSTCIGEEGLDVGEVDLIVCFDISNKSPIRMVQRMGRTGRKRAGSVLIMVTEGKEQQTLKDCLIHKNNISTHVLGSVQLNKDLYLHNPRLVPVNLSPKCEKMFITVTQSTKKSTILEKLQKSSGSSELVFTQNNDVLDYRDFIPETKMLSLTGNPLARSNDLCLFSEYIEKMRTGHKICLVEHSEYTTVLSELLCFADSKRFNIPTKSQGEIEGKYLKQGDIRCMLFKESDCISQDDGAMELIRKTPNEDLEIRTDENRHTAHSLAIPTEELSRLLSNYLISNLTSEVMKCPYCHQNFDCEKFAMDNHRFDSIINNVNSQNLVPSEDVVNNIALENIEDFIASLDTNVYTKVNKKLDDPTSCSEFENNQENVDDTTEKTFSFKAPATYLKLLETFRDTDFGKEYSQADTDTRKSMEDRKKVLDLLRIGSIKDIYNSPVESSQDTIIYTPDAELDKNDLIVTIKQGHVFDKSTKNGIQTQEINVPKISNDLNLNLQPEISLNKETVTEGIGNDIEDLCNMSFFDLANADISHIDNSSQHASSKLTKANQGTKTKLMSPNKNNGTTKVPTEHLGVSPTLHNTSKNNSNVICNISKGVTNESKITITQMINLFDNSGQEGENENKICQTLGLSPENYRNWNTSTTFHRNALQNISGRSFEQTNKCSAYDISIRGVTDIEDCSKEESRSKGIQETFNQTLPSSDKKCKVNRTKNINKITTKSRLKGNPFLDVEAEISKDNNISISEDEDDIFTDSYEKSFVNDVTQNFNTEIHGMYLRSIRSPVRRKICSRPKRIVADVYSQQPSTEKNEYVENCLMFQSQLSELDMLERELEQKKKRKNIAHAHSGLSKRRRIKWISSDDSE